LLSLPSLFLPLSSLITLVAVTLWTIVDGMKKKILFYSNNSCSIKKKILCVKIILNKSFFFLTDWINHIMIPSLEIGHRKKKLT
jgi:hypothetical protein